jgi:transposase InsO family protein
VGAPQRLGWELERAGVLPLPSRSTIWRILASNGLIGLQRGRRRRRDYRPWEREAPVSLWQMDVMGGVWLQDGTECKLVTGIDDHSRYCVVAHLVIQATGRAVCAALVDGLRAWGKPVEVLTDNGVQFTGRYAKPRRHEVLFERILRDNGIGQRLTKVRSPTTTGKVERFHQTLRRELLEPEGPFASLEQAQKASTPGWRSTTTSGPTRRWGWPSPSRGSVPASTAQVNLIWWWSAMPTRRHRRPILGRWSWRC